MKRNINRWILLIIVAILVDVFGVKEAAADMVSMNQDITADYLQSLTYGDNIPGFHLMPVKGNAANPLIELNLTDAEGNPRHLSRITGFWHSNDGLLGLDITCAACSTNAQAFEIAHYWMSGAEKFLPFPSRSTIGDVSWTAPSSPTSMVVFVVGRTAFNVGIYPHNRKRAQCEGRPTVSPLDARVGEIVDTLARGLEWGIRQHPELLADSDKTERRTLTVSGTPSTGAQALTIRNVAWSSLSAFVKAGATVKWNAKTNRATVSHQGMTIALRPFHREATEGKAKLDLGAVVMLGRDGPVVPVRKLAEALGMKVTTTKTTIHLD